MATYTQREDGWWAHCQRWGDASPIGPYATKKEAVQAATGVEEFFRFHDTPLSKEELHERTAAAGQTAPRPTEDPV